MLHRIMAPVDVHIESLWGCYLMWQRDFAAVVLEARSWDGKVILGYPSVPHVITSVLIKGRWGVRVRAAV